MNKKNHYNKFDITTAKPILIFPGSMPRSLDYLQRCLRDKQRVIGASSVEYDASREKYPDWLYLPYVTKPEFDEALKLAIKDFDIGGVYSPNPVIWNHLNRVLKDIAPTVQLVNGSPVNTELSGYRESRNHARMLLTSPLQLGSNSDAKMPVSELELAALFRHADLIPGMCDHEKLCALHEIARFSPRGDIVEIGSWWGKSAFILASLARHYDIGSLLCVDPWANEHVISKGANAMVESTFSQVDAEEALMVFEMSLLPYNANHINYLRMLSTDGAVHYRAHRSATTEFFGTTKYCGHISILHIDGNHAVSEVEADTKAWAGLVQKGGWIIFDDYKWAYGNGPKVAADEFINTKRKDIATSFFMGGAMFVQLLH
jgi:cephalosporin hydroxylase